MGLAEHDAEMEGEPLVELLTEWLTRAEREGEGEADEDFDTDEEGETVAELVLVRDDEEERVVVNETNAERVADAELVALTVGFVLWELVALRPTVLETDEVDVAVNVVKEDDVADEDAVTEIVDDADAVVVEDSEVERVGRELADAELEAEMEDVDDSVMVVVNVSIAEREEEALFVGDGEEERVLEPEVEAVDEKDGRAELLLEAVFEATDAVDEIVLLRVGTALLLVVAEGESGDEPEKTVLPVATVVADSVARLGDAVAECVATDPDARAEAVCAKDAVGKAVSVEEPLCVFVNVDAVDGDRVFLLVTEDDDAGDADVVAGLVKELLGETEADAEYDAEAVADGDNDSETDEESVKDDVGDVLLTAVMDPSALRVRGAEMDTVAEVEGDAES